MTLHHPPTPTELLAAALGYAARGWPVHPLHTVAGGACSCGAGTCKSKGKHPRLRHGANDASRDEGTIRGWWGRWPDANIGVATGPSGLLVVDVDDEAGYAALVSSGRELPETLTCRTGREGGGRHLYFDRGDARAASRAGVVPGIDTRAEGGYVVVAPSMHASGRRYAWGEVGAAVAAAPGWLLALVAPVDPAPREHTPRRDAPAGGTPYGRAALAGEVERVTAAVEGERRFTLLRAARALGQLVAGGQLEETEVVDELTEAASVAGLGRRETWGAIRDGLRYGQATPRAPDADRPAVWGPVPAADLWAAVKDATPDPAAVDWLRGRWGSELAAAIIADNGPALVVDAAQAPLRPAAEGYRLALPLHAWGGPRHGGMVTATHLWCADADDAPEGAEFIAPRERSRLPAAAVVAFGDPARVSRYTLTIIIAGSGSDWLAACGMVRLLGIESAVAVVGLPGASRAHAVGVALADRLRGILDGTMKADKGGRGCRVEAQPVAGSWRVVLATDADPAGDRAALELRGALGGLPVEVVRPRWDRGVDLSDRLAEVGPAAMWRELVNAGEWCAPAPQASPLYGPDAMSLEEAREDGIRGEIDAALDDARGGARVALALPVGTGKTRAALDVIAARARQGERFMVAVATWAFGDELCSVLDTIAPDVEVAVWQGVSAACHDDEDKGILARSAWEDAGRPAHWGATACQGCDLRAACGAHQRDEALIVIVAHAMLPKLRRKALGDRTIIIDEQPADVSTRQWTVRELDRLGDGAGSAAPGETNALHAEERQRAAWATWKPVHTALNGSGIERGRWGSRLDEGDDDACDALRHALAAASVDTGALLDALDAGATGVKPWSIPLPNVATMLRTGKAPARAVLPRDTHRLFALLARAVRRALGEAAALEDDGEGVLSICLPTAGGTPVYERRDVLELPAGGAVILDATAPAVPHVYSRLGVTTRTLAVESDPGSETLRLFRHTKGLRRSNLLRYGVGAAVVNRVLGELRMVIGEARKRGPRCKRPRVGLLTYKPIADALSRENATGAWAELQREAQRMGIEEVGYFGRDEEGTNRFEDCDCLVILGDPRPNRGARQSDLKALGIRDKDDQAKALDRELGKTMAQAVGRARAETRPGFRAVAVIGETMPVTWDRRSVVELAKRPADAMRAACTVAALTVASMTGCVVVSWLAAVVELAARRMANADTDNKGGDKGGDSAIRVGPSSELLESLQDRPEVGRVIDAAERALRESLPPGSQPPSSRTARRGTEDAVTAIRAEGWRVDHKPLPGRSSWRSVYHPSVALEDARAIVGWLVTWRGAPAPLPGSARAAWAWWLDAAVTVDELAQEDEDTPPADPEAPVVSAAVDSWGDDRGPP